MDLSSTLIKFKMCNNLKLESYKQAHLNKWVHGPERNQTLVPETFRSTWTANMKEVK